MDRESIEVLEVQQVELDAKIALLQDARLELRRQMHDAKIAELEELVQYTLYARERSGELQ